MAVPDQQRDFSGRQAAVAAGFVLCAVLLGGGGSPAPGAELLLQLVIAAVAAVWVWWSHGLSRRSPGPLFTAIVAAMAIFPLLQLIPLPPRIWEALPGRTTSTAALELARGEGGWQPLSLTPHATLAGWLAIISAAVGMLVAGRLGTRQRHIVLFAVLGGAGLTAVVGAFQLAGGEGAWRAYAASHRGWITGFMANRNAAADVLLIGLCAAVALAASRRRDGMARLPRGMAAALCVILAVAVIFTGSRTGIALLLVPAILAWVLLREKRRGLGVVAALFAVAALVPTFAGGALGRVGERFAVAGDFRTELWRDAAFAAGQFWPLGGGIGSFVPAVIAAERLEVVDATQPNRAHNDYLEFALEAGLPGLLLVAAIMLALAWQFVRRWRADPSQRPITGFAGATLAIVALHSAVDYPLRSMTLACLAAMAAGLLFVPRRDDESGVATG
ncbi:O-antigen ligase family protein [Pseudoblastomonas flavescens]|uniref:O-antigen ligase family protein n=1 Tax=Alteriqipengyuania flavescens TaxID=3053610 RepID=UPI0025B2B207|nr:O-antigen ligase family protein [Alteriqipengyuania flavescens]WJY18971.1 O-antigen ligase family protein [Alteriqipengyuania flavescens]